MRIIILRLIFGAVFIFYGSTFKMLQSQNNYVVKWLTNSSGNDWDYLRDVVIDNDGNIFAVGNYTVSTSFSNIKKEVLGDNDIFIIKYDDKGDVSWLKTINSKGSCYVATSCVDNVGNYYISGYFDDEIVIDETIIPCSTRNSAFVVKFNTKGNMEWFKNIGGYFGQYPLLLTTDNLSNLLIAGSFYKSLSLDDLFVEGNCYSDIFILTINSEGELINNYVFSGIGNDVIKDISVVGNDIYFAGNFEKELALFDTIISSYGGFDAFFVKYSSTDTSQILIKQVGSKYNDFGASISNDNDNNIIFTGTHSGKLVINDNNNLSSNGKLDTFILKYSEDGDFIWGENFGGPANDIISNSVLDDNGNIFLTGNYRGTIKENNFSIVSKNFSHDIFFAKYSKKGDLLFMESIGDSTNELAGDVLFNKYGNIILSGNLDNTKDIFDIKLDSISGNDLFIAELYDCTISTKITLPDDTILCAENFVIIADTGYYTYEWNLLEGGNIFATDTTGQFFVDVLDINGCASSDTIFVKLNVPQQVYIGDDIHVIKGEQIILKPKFSYKTYFWSNYSIDKSITINTHDISSGDHMFRLTVTDSNKCVSSDELIITIDTPLDLELILFPNPATDNLNYKINNISSSNTVQVTILTQSGIKVWNNNIIDNTLNYNGKVAVSSLVPGTYIFIVKNGDKIINQLFTIL